MKIIKACYEILTPINGLEVLKLIERIGRVCYKSEDKITENSCHAFIKMLISRGHEAMIEHYSFSVKFICDRGVSHEIVRHRIAAFAQESTRYCNYGNKNEGCAFVLPLWIESGEGVYTPEWSGCLGNADVDPFEHGSAASWWFWHCAVSERDYLRLLEHGWTPQEARSVLPNSLKTEIVMTANLREWRHFFKLRTANAAHPQMQEITRPLLSELKGLIPEVFNDITY